MWPFLDLAFSQQQVFIVTFLTTGTEVIQNPISNRIKNSALRRIFWTLYNCVTYCTRTKTSKCNIEVQYCSVSLRDIDSGSPESIEWFIEEQTRLSVILLLPNPSRLSFSVFLCVAGQAYRRPRGRGWGRSQIIRQRESLVIYIIQYSMWWQ